MDTGGWVRNSDDVFEDTGISVLQRASETISTARAAQSYSKTYYLNGGQPSGVLKTDEALTGTVDVAQADGTVEKVSHRDITTRSISFL